MAIKVNGTTVIDNSRVVSDVTLKNYTDTTFSLGTMSANTTIDLANGNMQEGAVNVSQMITFTNAGSGSRTFLLRLYMNAGYTITWPAAVRWPNSTAPTLVTGTNNFFVFNTVNGGTTWFGNAVTGYAA